MSTRAFILACCLCSAFAAHTQVLQRFNKISGTGETRSELAVLDSGFVTMVQDFHNWNALVVREYDTRGELIDSAHYDFGDFVDNGGDNLVKVPNSTDYILAQSYDQSVMLLRFNRQWDTLYTRLYQFQDSVQTNCYSLKMDTDSSFVFTGYAYRRDIRKIGLPLAKFDLNFNLKWETQINDPVSYPGGYQGLRIFPVDSGYLVGGVSFYFGGQLPNQGLYALVDNKGNLKWKHLVTKGKGVSALKIGSRADNNLFYVGIYELDTLIAGMAEPQRLIYGQFDLEGNLINEKEIGSLVNYFGVDGFTRLSNGHYVIGGRTYHTGRSLAHLFCFDEDGNTIWHHRYFYAYEREACLLENFKPAGSGLIAVGEVYDAERRFSNNGDKFQWLLSIDENGCVKPDSCGQYFSIPEAPGLPASIHLFPNPADAHTLLEWDHTDMGACTIEVSDVAGNRMLKKRLPNHIRRYKLHTANWDAGIYVLHVIPASGQPAIQKFVVRH